MPGTRFGPFRQTMRCAVQFGFHSGKILEVTVKGLCAPSNLKRVVLGLRCGQVPPNSGPSLLQAFPSPPKEWPAYFLHVPHKVDTGVHYTPTGTSASVPAQQNQRPPAAVKSANVQIKTPLVE
eukprot:Polyplicarium_translucidae@DN2593_c0_g2_i3.p3